MPDQSVPRDAPSLDVELLAVLRWLWQRDPLAQPEVQRRAREVLLDTLGCALAGAAEPEVARLAAQVAAADPGPHVFPGLAPGLTAAGLAMCVAAAACWHEACEGLAAAHGRPGLHAIPALLGPALAGRRTLGDVLRALIAGYEIGGRLGMVCRIRPGMHVDGTWGSLAAAAAVCHLAGQTPEATLAALNHVACHMPFSLYRPIALGFTARNAYVGHGAAHGAAAAAASAAGLGGPPGAIAEMARLALGHAPLALPALPGPGHWLIQDGYLKLYPAVKHVHYGAAAAEQWHAAAPAAPDAICGVTLGVYGEALTYCANRAPATAIQAQFSLSYGVAWCLAQGRLTPRAYAAAALTDPLVRRLEHLVTIAEDPALTAAGRRGCTLEVTAQDRVWRRQVESVPGDPETPMPRATIAAKFHDFSAPVLGAPVAAQLLHMLLDGSPDVPLALPAAMPLTGIHG